MNDNVVTDCIDCEFNESQEWYVTNDFTQVCHHEPVPNYIDDIREGDVECPFFTPEKAEIS